MKSTQLLSIVLSLIMFTGVTAGSAAFADSDELEDDIDDVDDDREEDYDYDKDDDYDKYDRHDSLEDRLEHFCEMSVEEKDRLYEDHPRVAEFSYRLAEFCNLSEDEREDAIEDFVEEHFPGERELDDYDIDEMLDRYCEMTDEDKRQLLADHPRLGEFSDRLENYCDLSEDEQDAIDELIEEHGDRIRHELKEYRDEYSMHDKYSNKGPGNLRDHFAMYCDMTAEKRAEKMEAMHDDLPDDIRADLVRYCEMSEDEQDDFRDSMMDRMDMLKDHMKDKMMDKSHMDYDRLCALSESDRAQEITDVAKLDRISDWCEMTPEEREDYKMKHKDTMKDKKHDFDGMSDVAKDRMSDVAKDKLHEKMMKFSDMSPRLKEMIKSKHGISDERYDEIKMKFKEKHGDLTDERKSELKMKFKNHMASMKFEMTDKRKSMIHDRLAEMKAFKAELREKSADMTDEQKQELREEFIEKAKDLQLAWITPRTQMTAGVDAAEVECREGFSLVMKASNGVAMCLKADTALEMIDRGIVVPAN